MTTRTVNTYLKAILIWSVIYAIGVILASQECQVSYFKAYVLYIVLGAIIVGMVRLAKGLQ